MGYKMKFGNYIWHSPESKAITDKELDLNLKNGSCHGYNSIAAESKLRRCGIFMDLGFLPEEYR